MNPKELTEKLSEKQRAALKPGDFVFADRKDYPIQSAKQAKTALTYARWPDNKKDWPEVWKAVKKRWPAVAKGFKGGRFWKEDIALGDLPHIREALEGARDLVAEVEANRLSPESDGGSVAALFSQDEAVIDRRAMAKAKKVPFDTAAFRAAKVAVADLKKSGYPLGRSELNYLSGAIERSLQKFFPMMLK